MKLSKVKMRSKTGTVQEISLISQKNFGEMVEPKY